MNSEYENNDIIADQELARLIKLLGDSVKDMSSVLSSIKQAAGKAATRPANQLGATVGQHQPTGAPSDVNKAASGTSSAFNSGDNATPQRRTMSEIENSYHDRAQIEQEISIICHCFNKDIHELFKRFNVPMRGSFIHRSMLYDEVGGRVTSIPQVVLLLDEMSEI